jgi:hypothetical protein
VGGRMSTRVVSWLACSTCTLSLVFISLSLLLFALTWSHSGVYVFDYWVENAMVAVVASTVGAVVASRRPDHPIGWLFCAIGLIGAARPLAAEYATYALVVAPVQLPDGAVLAWISAWTWVPHLGLMIFLGLLFPEGRLPSARWRPFAWIVVLAVFVGTVATAFSPGPLLGIDPLINRTLVYGSLTTALVGRYFVGIVVLQKMFVILTGHKSTVAVVASTLLIAVLFNPLRHRIQSLIDRSFYRSKYDARRTLEAFSVKLRDETDLEALNDDLVGVVKETMHPVHVSLWLRSGTSKGK